MTVAVFLIMGILGIFFYKSHGLRHREDSPPRMQGASREKRNDTGPKVEVPSHSGGPLFPTISARNGRPRLEEGFLEQEVIPKLLARASLPHRGLPMSLTRFQREEDWQLREGRLIAYAFPELLERLMTHAVVDPTMDGAQKYYAMFLLGYLAEQGRVKATEVLKQVASESDEIISARAVNIMAQADHGCQYKDFYMQRCSEKVAEAVKPLTFLGDAGTTSFLMGIASIHSDGSPRSFAVQYRATKALEKTEILASPDWQLKLGEIILKEEMPREIAWAIEAARRNSLPQLAELLRQRLDNAMGEVSLFYSAVQEKSGLPPEKRVPFEEIYRSQPAFGTLPFYLDDALVTQFELGGKLTDLERARLRTFGYGCDPKERLRELLGAD